jgi:putative colanic acid biosynthesis acetyltransferase WcaF
MVATPNLPVQIPLVPTTPIDDLRLNDRAWIDLTTYDQSYFDRGRPGWLILWWWFVQAVTFPLTPHFASGIRAKILRAFGAKIGEGVLIRPTARFTYPWKVEIGDYSWIGDDVVLYSLDRITIGNHCIISQKSYLCTGSHNIQSPSFDLTTAEITIGNGAWIASDCFVAPGVTIGSNSVVGARSTVMANLPAGKVCWGTPCKARYDRVMKP